MGVQRYTGGRKHNNGGFVAYADYLRLERLVALTEVSGPHSTRYNNLLAKNAVLHDRVTELEAAINKAPHQMGCHSIQDEFAHTKEWATLEYCDCWKRDVLTLGEG